MRAERVRRGIAVRQMAEALTGRLSFPTYPSTVTRIEQGDRDVRVDELVAYSQLFGVSVNALLGIDGSHADVTWAASKLASNAERMVADVLALQNKIANDVNDLTQIAERDGHLESVAQILHLGNQAFQAFEAVRVRLDRLATEFPLPGVALDGRE